MERTRPVGLLIDLARCRGCRHCVAACMKVHKFEGEPLEVTDLSSRALTVVRRGKGTWVRNICRHCLEPSCVSACIVGALKKDPLGPVTYDVDRCIGCRYCMLACPFNVPRYEWDSATPKVQKCDLCIGEVRQGRPPACVKACPFEATEFGPRDELLQKARDRIAAQPAVYHDHVYGEKEVGGTSVLFIAPAPVPELGFKPVLGERPLPERTKEALDRVPAIVLCGGAILSGLWWLIRRRDEVSLARAAAGRAAHERLHRAGTLPGEADHGRE